MVSFMHAIASTTLSGRLHSEFVRLLFLQAHRETDRLFTTSGVQLAQTNPSGQFHFCRATFPSMLKFRVGNILVKTAALRINLNLDGDPIASKSHTHPSHSQTSRFSVNLVFIFRCSSSTTNPVYERRVNLLVCSLPSHRHSYICLSLALVLSIHNKQQGMFFWNTTELIN